MKKRLLDLRIGFLVFCFSLLCYTIGMAQTATLNVVSSNGGYTETPGFSMSWSVGELSTSTQTDASGFLTQGFQQSFPLISLPIELIKFHGEALPEGNELKWVTSSETNNDFFTLLRATNDLSFSEVAIIEGAGSSFTQQNYQYLDIDAPIGRSYYQLRQTDFDGQTSLSEIISLQRLEIYAHGNLNMQIFPNPTMDELTVNFNDGLKEEVQLQVHDLYGKLIQKHVIDAGQYKINISLIDQPGGVYFLSVQSARNQLFHSTTRIVKSRL